MAKAPPPLLPGAAWPQGWPVIAHQLMALVRWQARPVVRLSIAPGTSAGPRLTIQARYARPWTITITEPFRWRLQPMRCATR